MPEPPLWDDTFRGRRWTYALLNRPVSGSNLPRGWIIKSDRQHPLFKHGTIDFPRRLTAREVGAFELELVSDPK
jgi:hypothetical protein